MTMGFVHLRVHTEYSLVDSVVRVEELVNAVLAAEMPAVALTDQSNLFGMVKFYRAAIEGGIKPVVGVDLLVCEAGERTPELFYNTGLLLQKSGQVEDAVRLYQEALAERPQFAEALLNLGHAMKAQGNLDGARNYWRQALEQKPELATGYFEQ